MNFCNLLAKARLNTDTKSSSTSNVFWGLHSVVVIGYVISTGERDMRNGGVTEGYQHSNYIMEDLNCPLLLVANAIFREPTVDELPFKV